MKTRTLSYLVALALSKSQASNYLILEYATLPLYFYTFPLELLDLQISDLDVYLVGGAVRDTLLNRKVKERDYLIVGATSEQMLALGFKQVGKDFPVFLHPETKEEYALARTERKSGIGYTGFICNAEPTVTLEQDLERRDLTINAIAQSPDGKLHDPYNGLVDLEHKILRHVSSAFEEDPLRILRVARFAARYAHLGFTIAPETLALMTSMVAKDELYTLPAERIWKEIEKSFSEESPATFIKVLKDCGALKKVLPEVDALWGVPNPEKWHPEIDTGIHTLMVLEQAAILTQNLATNERVAVRFAALCHDVGKGVTPKSQYPQHKGHETGGLPLVEAITLRLKVPKFITRLCLHVCEFHLHCHKAFELKSSTILKVFDRIDAWRNKDNFALFLLACEADFRGRTGFEARPYPQVNWLKQCFEQATKIDIKPLLEKGLKGEAIKEGLTQERTKVINKLKQDYIKE